MAPANGNNQVSFRMRSTPLSNIVIYHNDISFSIIYKCGGQDDFATSIAWEHCQKIEFCATLM